MGLQTSQSYFSRLQKTLWPLDHSDYRKFVPMLLMIFLMGVNYHLLKILKDTVLISNAGAMVIPYVKVWVLLPMAILLTGAYTKLSKKYHNDTLFYGFVLFFFFFYCLFFLLIFPNKESLYAHNFADALQNMLPKGARGLTNCIRFWPLVVFYPFCELWVTIVNFILFWGMANRITKLDQAKRYYSFFSLATNLSGVFSTLFFGFVSSIVSKGAFEHVFTYFGTPMDKIMGINFSIVALNIFVIISCYRYLTTKIFPLEFPGEDPLSAESLMKTSLKKSKKKKKISYKEALKNLLRYPYIRNLTIIVLSYNLFINLTEILWKAQLKLLLPDSVQFAQYFAKVIMVTSIVASISDFFICGPSIRKWGFTRVALVTPLILFVTSLFFFPLLLSTSLTESIALALGNMTPLAAVAFFGSAQNILCRSSKYSFFDTTKELAFIPLETELQNDAKATIDGIGSRLGKSAGSLLYQILFIVMGGLTASIPVVIVIACIILVFWVKSLREIGIEFNKYTQSKDQEQASSTNHVEFQSSSNIVINNQTNKTLEPNNVQTAAESSQLENTL